MAKKKRRKRLLDVTEGGRGITVKGKAERERQPRRAKYTPPPIPLSSKLPDDIVVKGKPTRVQSLIFEKEMAKGQLAEKKIGGTTFRQTAEGGWEARPGGAGGKGRGYNIQNKARIEAAKAKAAAPPAPAATTAPATDPDFDFGIEKRMKAMRGRRRRDLYRRDPFGGTPAIQQTGAVRGVLADMKSGPDQSLVVSSGSKIRAARQAQQLSDQKAAMEAAGLQPTDAQKAAATRAQAQTERRALLNKRRFDVGMEQLRQTGRAEAAELEAAGVAARQEDRQRHDIGMLGARDILAQEEEQRGVAAEQAKYTEGQKRKLREFEQAREKVNASTVLSPSEKKTALKQIEAQQAGLKPLGDVEEPEDPRQQIQWLDDDATGTRQPLVIDQNGVAKVLSGWKPPEIKEPEFDDAAIMKIRDQVIKENTTETGAGKTLKAGLDVEREIIDRIEEIRRIKQRMKPLMPIPKGAGSGMASGVAAMSSSKGKAAADALIGVGSQ